MSKDNDTDLQDFINISLILQNHEDKVFKKAFTELREIAGIIQACHHHCLAPWSEEQYGYVRYTRPNLVIIDDVIKQIKVIFNSWQHLLGISKKRREIALKAIQFEAEEIAKLSELTDRLRTIIAQERLVGYIYINLARLRYMGIWQSSLFADMKWQAVNTIVTDDEHENFKAVEELLGRVSDEKGWSVDIIKTWIHCYSTYAKEMEFYTVRMLKRPKFSTLCKLCDRLVNDEEAMVWVAPDDSLLSRSYRQAIATFREDWFKRANSRGYCLSKRAIKVFGWDKDKI
jgi:hypothetical protein